MNPALLSISELRNALAAGELSAGEITEHSLTLIERQNPAINAWTQITGPVSYTHLTLPTKA